jgi:hypothetical protein
VEPPSFQDAGQPTHIRPEVARLANESALGVAVVGISWSPIISSLQGLSSMITVSSDAAQAIPHLSLSAPLSDPAGAVVSPEQALPDIVNFSCVVDRLVESTVDRRRLDYCRRRFPHFFPIEVMNATFRCGDAVYSALCPNVSSGTLHLACPARYSSATCE